MHKAVGFQMEFNGFLYILPVSLCKNPRPICIYYRNYNAMYYE